MPVRFANAALPIVLAVIAGALAAIHEVEAHRTERALVTALVRCAEVRR